MNQDIEKMYSRSTNILNIWMEKLFPTKDQGCINFGYWRDIKKPLTKKKRIESQKNLYCEIFERFDLNCKTVLEVGCGRGHGIFWLRENGYEASGIDILPSQIETSKMEYPNLAHCFQLGKAEEIPFRDGSFDCVCSLEAAQHFTSFKGFCQESFRVLKQNGKLVVSTYFLNKRSFIKDLRKIIPNNLEGFHNALVISEAITLMQNSGFIVHSPPSSIGKEVFPFYSQWQKNNWEAPLCLTSQKKEPNGQDIILVVAKIIILGIKLLKMVG